MHSREEKQPYGITTGVIITKRWSFALISRFKEARTRRLDRKQLCARYAKTCHAQKFKTGSSPSPNRRVNVCAPKWGVAPSCVATHAPTRFAASLMWDSGARRR